MSFKTPFLVDRRVYDKRGKWKSPNNDIAENIFYYIKDPLTMRATFDTRGREELKETMTIVVFGCKPFIKEDTITLEDGTQFKVGENIVVNYFESNVLVKDMLKPRIESMELELE